MIYKFAQCGVRRFMEPDLPPVDQVRIIFEILLLVICVGNNSAYRQGIA